MIKEAAEATKIKAGEAKEKTVKTAKGAKKAVSDAIPEETKVRLLATAPLVVVSSVGRNPRGLDTTKGRTGTPRGYSLRLGGPVESGNGDANEL